MHPDYPVVEGHQWITKQWSLTLPGEFNRRVERGSLVLWRPGFTVWIDVWNNDQGKSPRELCDWVRRTESPGAFDQKEVRFGNVLGYSYRLREGIDDGRVAGLYAFAFDVGGQVNAAFYFDAESDVEVAESIWTSLNPDGEISH